MAADGTELPVAQALIRPYARAVAGGAIATAFDTTTSTFTLSYAVQPGITAVSLPARAYPNGYDVALEGACYDVTSAPGQMLLQTLPEAELVSLTITSR